MTTITAYAYNAAIHCPRCALAYAAARLVITRQPTDDESADIRDIAKDSEGNALHPIFTTDESPDGYCDTCGMAYGNAEPVARLLSVDAWRDAAGGWFWNSWNVRGFVPLAWCELSPRALMRKLREHGGAYPAPGRCAIEDDGHNVVIVMRGTREPIAAIEYGAVP